MAQRPAPERGEDGQPEGQRVEAPRRRGDPGLADVADGDPAPLQPDEEVGVRGLLEGLVEAARIQEELALYYNLNITLVSVIIAFVVGGIEILSIVANHVRPAGSPGWTGLRRRQPGAGAPTLGGGACSAGPRPGQP